MAVGVRRSPVARSLARALTALCCLAVLIACVEFALLAGSSDGPRWLLDLFPATGASCAGAGALAWWRRPSNGTGVLLLLGVLAWLLAALNNAAGGTRLIADLPCA
jgi:hypothetical protein